MAIKERSLEETPTWAVAVVCFVLLFISIMIEYFLHFIGHWFKKKHKKALSEALEKVKAELMLLGFISLLLVVLQTPVSEICIPRNIAATWHPCSNHQEIAKYGKDYIDDGRKILEDFDSNDFYSPRRNLATKGYDKCAEKGKVALVSAYGIHQLHIFIFVLAVFHVLYCIITYALGKTKMKKWKSWERETKTIEYQYANDPERFRFARDTSFGRRHLNIWSKSTFTLWITCFFRQFFGSVTKVDYLTLRHGFIMAHLPAGSAAHFDFQKYIERSLEQDFTVVVGISPLIWCIAVLFILTNTHGWDSYLWLPFIPLIVILIVGAKLQMIISKLGLRIQEKGDVVKGAPVVEPGDDLFWFGRPRFILFLIHLVLFTNAFQLAFFVWSTYEFTLKNCFHHKTEDIAIRITMGVLIQVLCSYITLPLYALVTQMGTSMRPTIFNDRVANALKKWHHTAKKQTKHGHSGSNTPHSSRPTTPTHGMSPVHLLHNYNNRSLDQQTSFTASPSPPRFSDYSGQGHGHQHFFDPESQNHSYQREITDSEFSNSHHPQVDMASPVREENEIIEHVKVDLSEFTFKK
ncbi:Mlo-related protein [Arabidopsis thaliana x Arabidopsis arenosa]|uniref:MLO-like protein n=1 Tax=Arabidopsis thaliana x Arabidopsis arenosa TaxID=1240361 RepID=A0A8T2ACI8_9BRAS|nr:Mlo-related protein [Arabidopsis thaliana x Arabidopsis arenosa]